MIEYSQRIKSLPPYLFAKIDEIKAQEIKKGKKLISLGIGDPDLPTPHYIIERLCEAAKQPKNHQYPSYKGLNEFRKAAANWYKRRFTVELNSDTEVLTLIGSKEGIAHFPLAFINPGDGVLVPNPGYPVYTTSVQFAGGVPLIFTLNESKGFLPDFTELEMLIKKGPKAKFIFLNYPNNPTSACASLDFFKDLVHFAKKHQIIVCHDFAYSEIFFDGKRPPSFLEALDAKDVGIEFHSVSKTFNMTGWRVGFAVGNSQIISGLAVIKENIDSGVFNACQEAAALALNQDEPFCSELRKTYQERRDVLVSALKTSGLSCVPPEATFYVWCKIPNKYSSEQFVMKLIQEKGIVATPGSGFGSAGEGYVRFTLCADIKILKQVAELLQDSIN